MERIMDSVCLEESFFTHFDSLDDPRLDNHNRRHNLHDVLVIATLGTICGADTWTEICAFGEAKSDWLKTFLKLPNGIPSHDTFGRIFALLSAEKFEQCFRDWISSLTLDLSREVIAIDGKTLRGSHRRSNGIRPLHIVSAWASEHRLTLGQIKTEEKSNEITAIPQLLDKIDVKNSIITIDAMGCQKNISQKILAQEADYVLSLKANQQSLHKDISTIFEQAEEKQYKKILHLRRIEKVHDHGRIETRKYTLLSARDPLLFELRWPGLRGIGKVDVTRTVNNQVERLTRYFITSLHYEQIGDFMKAVRSHWHIEINCHWSLDVSFREDDNRTRIGNAAENLAMIRRIALNLLKQETSNKRGITCKRKKAGWDNQYLMKVLSADNNITRGAK